ncbi:MAG: hypothetical protein AAB837_01590 [Patescibacteria group bacterium]
MPSENENKTAKIILLVVAALVVVFVLGLWIKQKRQTENPPTQPTPVSEIDEIANSLFQNADAAAIQAQQEASKTSVGDDSSVINSANNTIYE